jgi:hypothetical protein
MRRDWHRSAAASAQTSMAKMAARYRNHSTTHALRWEKSRKRRMWTPIKEEKRWLSTLSLPAEAGRFPYD